MARRLSPRPRRFTHGCFDGGPAPCRTLASGAVGRVVSRVRAVVAPREPVVPVEPDVVTVGYRMGASGVIRTPRLIPEVFVALFGVVDLRKLREVCTRLHRHRARPRGSLGSPTLPGGGALPRGSPAVFLHVSHLTTLVTSELHSLGGSAPFLERFLVGRRWPAPG